MDIVIKIGREVEGAGAIVVPTQFKKASRRHATLYWHDGIVTIEDNESANGTYVNGRRVAKTKVKEDDIVWLGEVGDIESYQLDMGKVFNYCRDTEKKARTDFSNEFEDVVTIYKEYQTKVAKIKNQHGVKQRVINYVPMVAGVVGAGIDLGLGPWGRGLFLVGGIVITLLLLNKSNKHDINEEIMELQIKYKKLYRCPKCGKEFGLNTYWKQLADDGKCPNPKCNAIFVKK